MCLVASSTDHLLYILAKNQEKLEPQFHFSKPVVDTAAVVQLMWNLETLVIIWMSSEV